MHQGTPWIDTVVVKGCEAQSESIYMDDAFHTVAMSAYYTWVACKYWLVAGCSLLVLLYGVGTTAGQEAETHTHLKSAPHANLPGSIYTRPNHPKKQTMLFVSFIIQYLFR